MLLLYGAVALHVRAFSTGSGAGGFAQSCDAVNICPYGNYGGVQIPQCPQGMHFVGGPQTTVVNPLLGRDSPRNPLFQIRTAEGKNVSSDPSTYTPGELVNLHLRVTNPWTESRRSDGGVGGMLACWPQVKELFNGFVMICGNSHHVKYSQPLAPKQLCGGAPKCAATPARKFLTTAACRGKGAAPQCRAPHPWVPQIAGNEIQAYETSKYMGLMMYAVDENENKVGEWEIPPESPPRFWTPPDPGCDGKTLMHADVRLKRFHHAFQFRAPAAGTGAIKFRVLIKHGYTNGGAFFWPLAPAMPGGMQSQYDLALEEAPVRDASRADWFVSTLLRASCTDVCAANEGRVCDAALLASAGDATSFEVAVRHKVTCKLPIIASCNIGMPAIASSGSQYCWHRAANQALCPAGETLAPVSCDDQPAGNTYRVCPCGAKQRRRLEASSEAASTRTRVATPSEMTANAAAQPQRLGSALALGVASAAALVGGCGHRGATLAVVAATLAALLPTARAHNWLQKPSSRADMASTIQPCPAKLGSAPNVQLNPGGSFPVEWRVGHPMQNLVFLTVVKSEHEAKLSLASNSVLMDYLARAPGQLGDVTCGTHRAATCGACKTGRCSGECVLSGGTCTKDSTNTYIKANPLHAEGNYLTGPAFDKYFIRTGTDSKCVRRDDGGVAEAEWRGTKIPDGDPRIIERPAPYNCADGLDAVTRDRSGPKQGKECRACGYEQWAYKADKKTYRSFADQARAYISAKYPWIISVSAYNIMSPSPHDKGFDISTLTIPASVGAGNFIMHYKWGGYSDCVDIAVLAPLAGGAPAVPAGNDFAKYAYVDASKATYARIDHCQFVRRSMDMIPSRSRHEECLEAPAMQARCPTCTAAILHARYGTCIAVPPAGQMSAAGLSTEQAVAACKARGGSLHAGNNLGLVHLNLVPLTPPPLATMAAAAPSGEFYNSDPSSTNIAATLNIPWGIGNCKKSCFASEPVGTQICYPLRTYGRRANAEQDWTVVPDDPEDQVWYSTCYKSNPDRVYDGATCPASQCVASVAEEWRFGDRCTTCASTSANAIAAAVPNWAVADVGSCEQCSPFLHDGPTFQLPPPDQPEQGWISPGGEITMKWIETVGGVPGSVDFTLTCSGCAADGWVVVGISTAGGMVGVNGIRWRLDTGAVTEVVITSKSGVGVATYAGASNLVKFAADPAVKMLTFTTRMLGTKDFPASGDQQWAFAFGAAGFAKHASGARGIANFNFDLARPPVPAPTMRPTFDASKPPSNVNDAAPPAASAAPGGSGAKTTSELSPAEVVLYVMLGTVGPFLVLAFIALALVGVYIHIRQRRAEKDAADATIGLTSTKANSADGIQLGELDENDDVPTLTVPGAAVGTAASPPLLQRSASMFTPGAVSPMKPASPSGAAKAAHAEQLAAELRNISASTSPGRSPLLSALSGALKKVPSLEKSLGLMGRDDGSGQSHNSSRSGSRSNSRSPGSSPALTALKSVIGRVPSLESLRDGVNTRRETAHIVAERRAVDRAIEAEYGVSPRRGPGYSAGDVAIDLGLEDGDGDSGEMFDNGLLIDLSLQGGGLSLGAVIDLGMSSDTEDLSPRGAPRRTSSRPARRPVLRHGVVANARSETVNPLDLAVRDSAVRGMTGSKGYALGVAKEGAPAASRSPTVPQKTVPRVPTDTRVRAESRIKSQKNTTVGANSPRGVAL